MTNQNNTPDESRPLIASLEEYLAGFPFYRTLSVVVLLIGLLVFFWPMLTTLPVWPITTKGRIFVESPEVYTRERLVNDRFGQAFWLEQQLEKLDEAENFTSARRDMALRIALATDTEAPTLPISELGAIPFDHEYQIKSALRAKIRQALLENQLDDRHDLTGNSVYGLKFDTSVIPGRNTRARAYVKIEVKLPVERYIDPSEAATILGLSLEDLKRPASDNAGALTERFMRFPEYYENWVASIEGRLNSYLADIPTDAEKKGNILGRLRAGLSGADKKESWPCLDEERFRELTENDEQYLHPVPEHVQWDTEEILGEALSKVLSIDARSMDFPNDLFGLRVAVGETQEIILPDPWNRYVTVILSNDKTCRNWKQFRVERLTQEVILADWSVTQNLTEEHLKDFFEYYASHSVYWTSVNDGETEEARGYEVFLERTEPDGNLFPGPKELKGLQLGFTLTDEILDELLTHSRGFNIEIARNEADPYDGGISIMAEGALAEVGMYNFAKDILTSESYLYTVFPKSDVTGVLESRQLSGAIGLDGLGLGGRASSTLSEATSQVVASQVSFSDDKGQKNVIFGWIIGSDGIQKPVQKSQFVLLSLPAYLRELELKVESGWVDRDARFRPSSDRKGESITMPVALPPDYEAFDTMISGSNRYGPAIFDRLMEEVTIETCRDAWILIPGARLWRSTQVTLAGEPADQIVVMPNMRGIMAHFDEITLRPGDRPTVHVWTSEGSDRIDNKVRVRDVDGAPCLSTSKPEPSGEKEPAASDSAPQMTSESATTKEP